MQRKEACERRQHGWTCLVLAREGYRQYNQIKGEELLKELGKKVLCKVRRMSGSLLCSRHTQQPAGSCSVSQTVETVVTCTTGSTTAHEHLLLQALFSLRRVFPATRTRARPQEDHWVAVQKNAFSDGGVRPEVGQLRAAHNDGTCRWTGAAKGDVFGTNLRCIQEALAACAWNGDGTRSTGSSLRQLRPGHRSPLVKENGQGTELFGSGRTAGGEQSIIIQAVQLSHQERGLGNTAMGARNGERRPVPRRSCVEVLGHGEKTISTSTTMRTGQGPRR